MHMATQTKHWTLEELHRLPDDGNRYELVRGDLFVTPAPTEDHETILAHLSAVLTIYVETERVGLVYHPRAVVRFEGSEVEPDLMVRQPKQARTRDWEGAAAPILVIEVLSPFTRRRDHLQKRALYRDAGVPEYWIVDGERRSVRVVRPDAEDVLIETEMRWHPAGAGAPLTFHLDRIFGERAG